MQLPREPRIEFVGECMAASYANTHNDVEDGKNKIGCQSGEQTWHNHELLRRPAIGSSALLISDGSNASITVDLSRTETAGLHSLGFTDSACCHEVARYEPGLE